MSNWHKVVAAGTERGLPVSSRFNSHHILGWDPAPTGGGEQQRPRPKHSGPKGSEGKAANHGEAETGEKEGRRPERREHKTGGSPVHTPRPHTPRQPSPGLQPASSLQIQGCSFLGNTPGSCCGVGAGRPQALYRAPPRPPAPDASPCPEVSPFFPFPHFPSRS